MIASNIQDTSTVVLEQFKMLGFPLDIPINVVRICKLVLTLQAVVVNKSGNVVTHQMNLSK